MSGFKENYYLYSNKKLRHDEKTRYVIIEDSLSGHCCFEFSIVDTKGKTKDNIWDDAICETFDLDDAIKICSALNNQNENVS